MIIDAPSMEVSPTINQAKMGDSTEAHNADAEETLPILYISNHVAINESPSSHEKPSNTPIEVATPLPPLNLKNTG